VLSLSKQKSKNARVYQPRPARLARVTVSVRFEHLLLIRHRSRRNICEFVHSTNLHRAPSCDFEAGYTARMVSVLPEIEFARSPCLSFRSKSALESLAQHAACLPGHAKRIFTSPRNAAGDDCFDAAILQFSDHRFCSSGASICSRSRRVAFGGSHHARRVLGSLCSMWLSPSCIVLVFIVFRLQRVGDCL
jgi:hypothetical protein